MAERVLGVLGRGLVDADAPLLRADDLGVVRGDGCFETLRLVDGVPEELAAHLERLRRSAARLDLPEPDLDAWRELVTELAAAWGRPGEAVLRLVLTRGVESGGDPTAFAMVGPVPPDLLRQRREGVRVRTLDRGVATTGHEDAPWLLAGVKATSYAVNMAAQRHARAAGADDVIFVSTDGQVLEGPTATVVWLAGGHLNTVPMSLGVLDGTTVRTLFRKAGSLGLFTAVRRAQVADLHAAEDVWLVSSVRGAVRVVELDGRRRPDSGRTGEMQRALGVPEGTHT